MQARAADLAHTDVEPLLRRFAGELPAFAAARRSGEEPVADCEHLVDSLIACIGYVGAGAQILRSPSALPPKLRPIALGTPQNESWRAWSVDDRTRFVRARACIEVALKLNRPALLASFYDMDGRRVGAGIWTLAQDGRWRLYDVMDAALPGAAALRAAGPRTLVTDEPHVGPRLSSAIPRQQTPNEAPVAP